MENKSAKNLKEIKAYRDKIFSSKEKCRKIFRKEPFEKKLKTAFELYKQANYLKKFKMN